MRTKLLNVSLRKHLNDRHPSPVSNVYIVLVCRTAGTAVRGRDGTNVTQAYLELLSNGRWCHGGQAMAAGCTDKTIRDSHEQPSRQTQDWTWNGKLGVGNVLHIPRYRGISSWVRCYYRATTLTPPTISAFIGNVLVYFGY